MWGVCALLVILALAAGTQLGKTECPVAEPMETPEKVD